MPITVVRGLPGSGKSSLLIQAVNDASAQGRPMTIAMIHRPRMGNPTRSPSPFSVSAAMGSDAAWGALGGLEDRVAGLLTPGS